MRSEARSELDAVLWIAERFATWPVDMLGFAGAGVLLLGIAGVLAVCCVLFVRVGTNTELRALALAVGAAIASASSALAALVAYAPRCDMTWAGASTRVACASLTGLAAFAFVYSRRARGTRPTSRTARTVLCLAAACLLFSYGFAGWRYAFDFCADWPHEHPMS